MKMKIKWQLFWMGFLFPIMVSLLWAWSLWVQFCSIKTCFTVAGIVYLLTGPYIMLMWYVIPDKEWQKYE